eukprot:2873472-Pyramimonas_sp.AAC.1
MATERRRRIKRGRRRGRRRKGGGAAGGFVLPLHSSGGCPPCSPLLLDADVRRHDDDQEYHEVDHVHELAISWTRFSSQGGQHHGQMSMPHPLHHNAS